MLRESKCFRGRSGPGERIWQRHPGAARHPSWNRQALLVLRRRLHTGSPDRYLSRLKRITEDEMAAIVAGLENAGRICSRSQCIPSGCRIRGGASFAFLITSRSSADRPQLLDPVSVVCQLGRDRTGDNLAIAIADPRKYKCWAGCSKEMIRSALGCPIRRRSCELDHARTKNERFERKQVLALRGLRLPATALKQLRQTGIYCEPSVSIEHQHLARKYVIRGVESGGGVAELGHYVGFVDTHGQSLPWLQRVHTVGTKWPACRRGCVTIGALADVP